MIMGVAALAFPLRVFIIMLPRVLFLALENSRMEFVAFSCILLVLSELCLPFAIMLFYPKFCMY
jgi:hypothetical protein